MSGLLICPQPRPSKAARSRRTAFDLGYHNKRLHIREEHMAIATKWIVAVVVAAAFVGGVHAQDSANRKEMKRVDLTGTKMEVILSTTEYQPGETIPRHIHHGEEAFYVLEGATVETPDGKQIQLATGAGSINLRDAPHAGFKVVGDKSLKVVTVHIVDKGAPLYDAPPK
jgi:quercetin dioxygenase-like cupin family protein